MTNHGDWSPIDHPRVVVAGWSLDNLRAVTTPPLWNIMLTQLFATTTIVGCNRTASPIQLSTFYVKSYDQGVFTIVFDGKVYKAQCYEAKYYLEGPAFKGHESCTSTLELVARYISDTADYSPLEKKVCHR